MREGELLMMGCSHQRSRRITQEAGRETTGSVQREKEQAGDQAKAQSCGCSLTLII